jgi:hypothetical protein
VSQRSRTIQSNFEEVAQMLAIFQIRLGHPASNLEKSKIMIDKVPAARASKEVPMPLSKDWRILYIRGTQNHTNPAIDVEPQQVVLG